MTAGKPFVWLASYPKSGNTWVRALLTAYLGHGEIDLHRLRGGGVQLDRGELDDFLGVPSSELTDAELRGSLHDFHVDLAGRMTALRFAKVHGCFDRDARGRAIFPGAVSRGAVCIVRNPLDVVLSFADQFGETIDQAIESIDRDRLSHRGGLSPIVERWGRWSGHVRSWLDQSEMPVLLLRYERLIEDTAGALADVLALAGVEVSAERVAAACLAARFETLRASEAAVGFHEKMPGQGAFFRSGTAGGWRAVLTREQVGRIVADHGPMMERLGYKAEALAFLDA